MTSIFGIFPANIHNYTILSQIIMDLCRFVWITDHLCSKVVDILPRFQNYSNTTSSVPGYTLWYQMHPLFHMKTCTSHQPLQSCLPYPDFHIKCLRCVVHIFSGVQNITIGISGVGVGYLLNNSYERPEVPSSEISLQVFAQLFVLGH